MEVPKFLFGDNTDHPDRIFIVHTEFPRFVIDLSTDDLEFMEEFDQHDQKEMESEIENCIKLASDFYDREIARYEDD